MDNLQKLALSTTRNLRFYFDSAYKHGNTCVTVIRNSCNHSLNRASSVKLNRESELLCSNGNTRQRSFVEIANPGAAAGGLTQRRNISTTNVNLTNIFNIQDDKDFKERVLKSKNPVIVDFYAIWCGPCKILAPKLEQILAGYEGKAEFAKVDIDKHSDLAFDYNVQSVPTVIAFKNGKAVSQFIGVQDDDKIKKFVDDVVEKP